MQIAKFTQKSNVSQYDECKMSDLLQWVKDMIMHFCATIIVTRAFFSILVKINPKHDPTQKQCL